jgi:hypothetical protein
MLQAGRSGVQIPMSLDFSIDLILPATHGHGVDSASNRNEYQEPSWRVKGWPAPKADNLTLICEPIVLKMWKPRRVSQPYGPPRLVTGITTFFFLPFCYSVRGECVVEISRS